MAGDASLPFADIQLITVSEFARMARLSRRQIDRMRRRRENGFPREYDLATSGSKPCPRFKLSDVERWLDSRALW
jgi:predicted DNA-binding transcriptional regulator AlpA